MRDTQTSIPQHPGGVCVVKMLILVVGVGYKISFSPLSNEAGCLQFKCFMIE